MRIEPGIGLYRLLFEHSADAVFFSSPEGRILAANRGACHLLGRSEEEILRTGRSGVVDESDPRLSAALAERKRTGWTRSEIPFLRADGSRILCEVTSAEIKGDEGQAGAATIVRDLSKQKLLEHEKTQYFKLFMLSNDPMCIADASGCITRINAAFERLTGYTDAEIVSGKCLDFIVPEDRQKTAEEMTLLVSTSPLRHFENRYRCKNGSEILLSWTAVFDPDDSVIYATARDITEHRRLERRARQIDSVMMCIRRINERLLVADDETALYQFVCDELGGLEHVSGAWVGLAGPENSIDPVASAGVALSALKEIGFHCDDAEARRSPVGSAILGRKAVIVANVDTDRHYGRLHEAWRRYGVRTHLVVPISVDDEVIGALAIWASLPNTFDDETLGFLVEVAGDIGVGVRSIQLRKRLTATLDSVREALEGTVDAIATMLEFRDPYTAGHQQRVAHLAAAIGSQLGLTEKRVEGLRVIGYLHDIGKINVPAELLSKPTRLSLTEYTLIQQHPNIGYAILKNLRFPWAVADAVIQHHERLDGSGYPDGLKGDNIMLDARIIAVADTVEAMASHRPYRPGFGIERAMEEIASGRGRIFDPMVADACVELVGSRNYQLPTYQAHH